MMEWILNGGGVPEVLGEYVHRATFNSSNESRYGYSCDLSGDTSVMAVGAIWSGKMHIYNRQLDGTYEEIQTISGGRTTRVGRSVAISGDGLVLAMVGDIQHPVGTMNIYTLDVDGQYLLSGNFTLSAGGGFSCGISHDGGVVVAGDNVTSKAYIYAAIGNGSYEQVQVLSGSGYFGTATGISSDGLTVAIGSYGAKTVTIFTSDGSGLYTSSQVISGNASNYGIHLHISSDGSTLIIAGTDRQYNIFCKKEGVYTLLQTAPGDDGGCSSSGDGGVVLFGKSVYIRGDDELYTKLQTLSIDVYSGKCISEDGVTIIGGNYNLDKLDLYKYE